MPSREKLSEFTAWCRKNITGDEKGEAQIFLDRLFIAFGHPGSLDVGGEPEFRIRKATEDGGGTSFADYVWKPNRPGDCKPQEIPQADQTESNPIQPNQTNANKTR
jgi:hypothetical protein